MHDLRTETVTELRRFVQGLSSQLADGEVRLVLEPLPGRMVIGAARQGQLLWVIVDLGKPDARQHLGRLIDEWPIGSPRPPSARTLRIDDVLTLLTPLLPTGDAAHGPVVIRQ